MRLLEQINDPHDLRQLSPSQLPQVATEAREYMIEVLSRIGGHTGASLGAVAGDDEIAARLAKWTQPAPRYTRGVLAKYAKLVSSASLGAVTDLNL